MKPLLYVSNFYAVFCWAHKKAAGHVPLLFCYTEI